MVIHVTPTPVQDQSVFHTDTPVYLKMEQWSKFVLNTNVVCNHVLILVTVTICI